MLNKACSRSHFLDGELKRASVKVSLEPARPRLVWRLEPDQSHISRRRVRHHLRVRLQHRGVDPLDVDVEPGGQREDVVVVGQERVRRALRIQPGLDEVGPADDRRGSVDVDVALVEQAQSELLQQQSPHRDVNAVLGLGRP